MSTIPQTLEAPAPPSNLFADAVERGDAWRTGAVAALVWAAFGLLTWRWPNHMIDFSNWMFTAELGVAALIVGIALFVVALAAGHVSPLRSVQEALQPAGPWLIAVPVVLVLQEVLTAKSGALPTPFFVPPQALIEIYSKDWPRLGDDVLNMLKLLGIGCLLGTLTGFLMGVSIGWSRAVSYWVHPVLRILGPLPVMALLSIAFYFFPSSYSTATFLIALAAGFPVAVLTWSGVAGVSKNYYDVARTLGASNTLLILRVVIPAALPQMSVGLFMGLGVSFTALVTAEMMGMKSGLGWYLTWAQGWAPYVNMYAALIVMALLFSSIITLLFKVCDHALVWQKGTLKW